VRIPAFKKVQPSRNASLKKRPKHQSDKERKYFKLEKFCTGVTEA